MSWNILPKNVLQYFLTKLKGLMYTKTEVDNLIPSITPNPSTTTGVLNGLEIDGTAYEIQGTGEPNVQADWDEVDSTADDYIKNKPTIPTYNFLGVNFHSGNSSSQEHDCNNMTENGLYYYTSNGPASLGEQSTDGAVMVMAHSANWLTQLAQDYRTGKIYVRSRKNGAWQSWIRVDYSDGMRYTGTANDCFTVHQTSGSFMGRSNWASYLICNHGNGATYYSQTICLPFWGSPIYRRLEGGTDRGWKAFITEENIASQSVSYASNAGTVNGKTVGANVPSNAVFTDTNNAVTQTNSNDSGNFRVLFSGTADSTTRTEGVKKSTKLLFNPFSAVFHVYTNDNTKVSIDSTGVITFPGTTGSNGARVYSSTRQHMYLRASDESDYGIYIGIQDNVWAVMPPRKDYMRLGTPNYRWNQIYSSNSAISTSDRKEKKDIVPLDESARDFIMDLNPVSYKMINGDSGRTHYGMIAQDVEEELEELGMTAMDFAGLCKDKKMKDIQICVSNDGKSKPEYINRQAPIPGEYIYGLRYEEFIAPLIKTVQLQQQEIEELKHRIDILEGK